MLVDNGLDQNGDYSYLPDDCVVQTFVQFRNAVETDALGEDYFENFVASFDYVPGDLGEVPEARLRSSASCGPEKLGEIDGLSFREVNAAKLACGFYEDDLKEFYIMNSTRKGVKFNSAFQRRFTEPPLQELKLGTKLKVIGGFNVFDDKNDAFRTYYGHGEEVEVELAESTAGLATSLGNAWNLAMAAAAVTSVLAF